MKRTLFLTLPECAKEHIRRIRDFVRGAAHVGKKRWCPICQRGSRTFLEYGSPSRRDALCPWCGSLERHRFVWRYFKEKTDLFNRKIGTMLHVAPERCLERRLKRCLGDAYRTADLNDPRVMEKMDITNIQHPAAYFDVIYCSHVLEHVDNDRRAIAEFYRVLKNNGWAILLVPITTDVTFEDPKITDPQERLKFFGQVDHVRRYGGDYVDRLREAGFSVKTTVVADLCNEAEAILMGLTAGSGDIYHCVK